MNRLILRVTALLAVVLVAASAGEARAHVFEVTEVLAVLKTDGSFQIDMLVDVDALALGRPDASDSEENAELLEAASAGELDAAIERARDTIVRRVRVRFDGVEPATDVHFPEPVSVPGSPAPTSALGTVARLTGGIPAEAKTFTFGASEAFGPVQLTVLEQATLGGARHLLAPGDDSPVYALGERKPGASTPDSPLHYLFLGFEHIVPRGVDHMLFVLGLFLLRPQLKPLLWQITAFTVAHSVTLALAIYGVVDLPPRVVEPLIALSIAYVAVENLFTSELHFWRPTLVFGFGLLHGLGFAGVLRELGLPAGELVSSLFAFNVGVELGQLTVVGLALLAVGWARDRPWYRKRVSVPVSAAIAAVSLWWALERSGWLG